MLLVFTGRVVALSSTTGRDSVEAVCRPEKPVAKFKYTSNGGRSEAAGLAAPMKAFYKGWTPICTAAKAMFTFLGNLPATRCHHSVPD